MKRIQGFITVVAMLGTVFVAACDDDTQQPAAVDPCTVSPCSTEAVISQLQDVYRVMDPDRFAALLHPDFLFQLQPDPLNPEQPADWGRTEEVRIHERMFEPEQFASGSDPVPQELWLSGITIHLASSRQFTERPEFYASPTNPSGLDSTQVTAWGTDFNDSVLFETLGETDYQVTGQSYFVVVEDRTKPPSAAGAFLLYRWQELGGGTEQLLREPSRWSSVKSLYN